MKSVLSGRSWLGEHGRDPRLHRVVEADQDVAAEDHVPLPVPLGRQAVFRLSTSKLTI